MKHIVLTPELCPDNTSLISTFSSYEINTKVRNLSKVKMGEDVMTVIEISSKERTIPVGGNFNFPVFAPCDGWIDFGEIRTSTLSYGNKRDVSVGDIVARIYETYDELEANLSPNHCKIETDSFTGEQHVLWDVYQGVGAFFTYRMKGFRFGMNRILIGFDISRSSRVLRLMYDDLSYRKVRLKVKDSLTLLFDDQSILTYTIRQRPCKSNQPYFTHTVDIPITQSDLEILSRKNLTKLRLSFGNGDPVLDCDNDFWNDIEIGTRLFRRYVNDYISALRDNNITFEDNREIKQTEVMPSVSTRSETCFVYLMVDTINGYHKIGISNHPEYREHTLQSEKPSIELLCAKEFPSRLIAEAIESALHKAYDSKRLRGEWFNLSPKDIQDIKDTLR